MPMRIGTEMPSLEGATEWFNATAAAAAEEAQGHPPRVPTHGAHDRPLDDARPLLVGELRDV